jgi:hypothetical protein
MLAVLSRALSSLGGRRCQGPSACGWQLLEARLAVVGAAAGGGVLSVQIRCIHSGRCMARRNVCVWRRRPAQAVSSIGDMDFWRARYSSPPTSRLQHEPTTQGLPTTRARQNPRTHAAALPGAEHLNRACQSLTSCTAPPDLLLSAAGPDGLPWHRRRLAISNHTSRLACTPAGLAGPLQHDSHTARTRMQKNMPTFRDPGFCRCFLAGTHC